MGYQLRVTRHLAGSGMPPDAFAVVMATGIIAIDAQHQSLSHLDLVLTIIAATVFGVLLLDAVLRAVTSSRTPFRHLRRADTALRLFSFVAACSVLGARFRTVPAVLWALGTAALLAWLVLTPLAVVDIRSRPFADLREHAHGAWLLSSVATAGLSITAADLGADPGWAGWVVLSIVAWLLAALAYVATAALIARRALARLAPEDVTPDSWILMGAVAILTLAAAHLRTALQNEPVFAGLTTAIEPTILTLWILATLWIPVLLAAEVWHFDRGRDAMGLARTWWSAVFPLGMYSSATEATASQLQEPILHTVALIFFWIALGMFVAVSLGWLRGQIHLQRSAA